MGWGLNPLPLVADHLARGTLRPLIPDTGFDVMLYWQSSRLMGPALAPVRRAIMTAARDHLVKVSHENVRPKQTLT